jgi:hypothetical protein
LAELLSVLSLLPLLLLLLPQPAIASARTVTSSAKDA